MVLEPLGCFLASFGHNDGNSLSDRSNSLAVLSSDSCWDCAKPQAFSICSYS